MIEFYGKVSPTCNGKANRERMRERGTGALILAPIWAALGAFSIVFVFFFPPLFSVTFGLFFFSLIFLITGISAKLNARKPPIPCPCQDTTSVLFEDSWITYEEIELERTVTLHINDIKKAIDLGDCYLLFVHRREVRDIVCQKSLLVEGELEAFEELIADKLQKA
ncbi:MAG: hypothetical protein IJW98_00265 [Clostridia bacterium]|nr:hypothetical protein [Clostridia bacterium]